MYYSDEYYDNDEDSFFNENYYEYNEFPFPGNREETMIEKYMEANLLMLDIIKDNINNDNCSLINRAKYVSESGGSGGNLLLFKIYWVEVLIKHSPINVNKSLLNKYIDILTSKDKYVKKYGKTAFDYKIKILSLIEKYSDEGKNINNKFGLINDELNEYYSTNYDYIDDISEEYKNVQNHYNYLFLGVIYETKVYKHFFDHLIK